MNKLMSIDCSTNSTGYATGQIIGSSLFCEEFGILSSKEEELDKKIDEILDKIMEVINERKVELVYIEDVYVNFGNKISPQTIIVLSQLQGALKLRLRNNNIPYLCKGINAIHWRSRSNGIGKYIKDKGIPSKLDVKEYMKNKLDQHNISTKALKDDETDALGILMYASVKNNVTYIINNETVRMKNGKKR